MDSVNRKYKGMFGKDLVGLKPDASFVSAINRACIDTSKMDVDDFMRFLKDEPGRVPLR